MTKAETDDERRARRGWVLPLLLLVAASALYARVALGPALPLVVPALLERSVATESELARAFRAMVAAISFVLPPLMIFAIASITWGLARLAGTRAGYSRVFTIVARSSLFAAAGLLVKTLLVLATESPDPPVNLGFWVAGRTPIRAALLALTNPFVVASAVSATRGLAALGFPTSRAALAGATPWALGAIMFAQSSAGGVMPKLDAVSEGWSSIRGTSIELRHPRALAPQAAPLAKELDAFGARLREKLGATPRVIAIDVFPSHAALERAIAEELPVEVTGSIRGRDLLYLEMPGRSAAVPRGRALQDAARYVALLLIAPQTTATPRWFVEGVAHAEAVPYSPGVDRSYLEILRRRGVSSLAVLEDDAIYRTPDGPVLARALVDFLAFRHGGRATIDGVLRDSSAGTPFRDALYSRTRVTLSELETGWQESVRAILETVPPGTDGAREGAPDSSFQDPASRSSPPESLTIK